MKKEFIPYEEALALKELCFDESCLGFYLNGNNIVAIGTDRMFSSEDLPIVKAPLYQQAFRWFREKYGLLCYISSRTTDTGETLYIGNGRTIPDTVKNGFIVDNIKYDPKKTYREAELACLRKLIDIVEEKK